MQMVVQHCFMFVFVVVAVLAVNMNMCVDVCMLVGMNSIAMAMLVGMSVCMLMCMLQFNGILNHKIGADNHHNQGNIKLDCRSFTQKQHTKSYPKKRSN